MIYLVLRWVWKKLDGWFRVGEPGPMCDDCGTAWPAPHAEGCEVAALLRAFEGKLD